MNGSSRLRPLLTAAAALAAVLALAACGGDDAGDAAGQAETAVEQGGAEAAAQALREEAALLDAFLQSTIVELQGAQSLEEAELQVESAREELGATAERLRELEVEGEAEPLRDELEAAVTDLEAEVTELEAAVRARDLPAVLRGVSDLSLADVQAAIARIDTELGG